MKKYLNIKNFFLVILLLCTISIGVTIGKEYSFLISYGRSEATDESTKIGTISLYASPAYPPTLSRYNGHSWIYIKNLSGKDLDILGYTISPNEGISFGTTGSPKMSSTGIWVNLEGYNHYYRENLSITSDFYEEDLEYLEVYLSEHNKWTLLYNCTTFASGIWNNSLAGQENPVYSITPLNLHNKMSKMANVEVNREYIIEKDYFPIEELLDY